MGRIRVRVEHRDFEAMWADVKNGVLQFEEHDGTIWTTNRNFCVTEERDVEKAQGGRGVGSGSGTVGAKRLRKISKAHGRAKHDSGLAEAGDSAVHQPK